MQSSDNCRLFDVTKFNDNPDFVEIAIFSQKPPKTLRFLDFCFPVSFTTQNTEYLLFEMHIYL